MRTDNPLSDFNRWDAAQQKKLSRLPVCEYCGEPIQDEHFYLVNGEAICQDCLEREFKVRTDDYLE